MVIITALYLLFVYLIFHKFKLPPWNKVSKGIRLVIGVPAEPNVELDPGTGPPPLPIGGIVSP